MAQFGNTLSSVSVRRAVTVSMIYIAVVSFGVNAAYVGKDRTD